MTGTPHVVSEPLPPPRIWRLAPSPAGVVHRPDTLTPGEGTPPPPTHTHAPRSALCQRRRRSGQDLPPIKSHHFLKREPCRKRSVFNKESVFSFCLQTHERLSGKDGEVPATLAQSCLPLPSGPLLLQARGGEGGMGGPRTHSLYPPFSKLKCSQKL